MTTNKSIYFGLLIILGCSTAKNDNQVDGHWHCIKPGQCEFETLDIKDSIITVDKYVVGSFIQYLSFDSDNRDGDKDVEVEIHGDELTLNYADTSFSFIRADLKKCLVLDRYIKSMIDLSLPRVETALPFDSSITRFRTGDLLIGKLKRGIDDSNDNLAIQYPDSIFIQVNDVLINYKDISKYMRELKNCLDCPRENINLHVDKDVPEGIVGIVVKLINPGDSRSTIIHNVVQMKNGDIGLLKR